jgi:hypothetical protein
MWTSLAQIVPKAYLPRTPHHNSIINYFETPALTPILRTLIEESRLPMKAIETRFAVDSAGFTTCQYAHWFDAKYGEERERHEWVKAHVMWGEWREYGTRGSGGQALLRATGEAASPISGIPN